MRILAFATVLSLAQAAALPAAARDIAPGEAGFQIALGPLPADALGGAGLDRLFDAVRPSRPLTGVTWPQAQRQAVESPRRASPIGLARASARPAPAVDSRLLVPRPVETAASRRDFGPLLSAPSQTDRYDSLILKYAQRFGLNPRLLKAMIAAESEFMRHAVSRKGARGLMQLTPDTAGEMGVAPDTLSEPEANIRAGASYINHLFQRLWRRFHLEPGLAFSQAPLWIVQRMIAAYNSGPRFLAHDKLFPETRAYIRKVLLFLASPVTVLRRHLPQGPEPMIVPPASYPR